MCITDAIRQADVSDVELTKRPHFLLIDYAQKQKQNLASVHIVVACKILLAKRKLKPQHVFKNLHSSLIEVQMLAHTFVSCMCIYPNFITLAERVVHVLIAVVSSCY
jgi:hypothetical protein